MPVSIPEPKPVIRRDLHLVTVFCHAGLLVGPRRWCVCEVKDAEHSLWGLGVNFLPRSRRSEPHVLMVGTIWAPGVCSWFSVSAGLPWGTTLPDRPRCKRPPLLGLQEPQHRLRDVRDREQHQTLQDSNASI